MGLYDEAIKYYKKSIMFNKNYGYSFLNLGELYKEQGKYKEAINILTEGILHNKYENYLYYNRACYYVHENYIDKAINDIQTALKLNPQIEVYVKKDKDLERVLPFIKF
ncbi:tetratricopeptide repeat protein [Clostridium cochlearium]|uniref:Tetratricopeptide repeat-containing protein n=1 Tax=Clostridium cochlearium TaxID=1494 RepID=A0ABY0QLI4_CLOCO|nr:tetratricopeptide repeat protein [Clostridium cochlearium]MBV1818734.1 tetratricopeptide repeat protein [Bacteroidales bacterium MSK.15.36]MCG4571536.1 tetratricopeptide repeat protein [Clostridium cochlearium]MCR1971756.1 tetratricopeptide repeat protein [Clostridium cochlearium]NMA58491.1 tetratricopeptide repeat protein [Clostridium cochlearium]SDL16557.1 Tetratricopeptide repeat-containing protein [Clostridium cochlearium]